MKKDAFWLRVMAMGHARNEPSRGQARLLIPIPIVGTPLRSHMAELFGAGKTRVTESKKRKKGGM